MSFPNTRPLAWLLLLLLTFAVGLQVGCDARENANLGRVSSITPDAPAPGTTASGNQSATTPAAGASANVLTTSSEKSSMTHDDTDALGSFPKPVQDLDQPGSTHATAVFAGGCFWCTEAVFEQLKGVGDVVSGYAGGKAATADYQAVSTGTTGHAEAVQISYDPSVITYGTLLRVFFATHDPTELNRQGNDVGTQYRSAIFYHNQAEKDVAQAYIKQLDDTKDLYKKPIVTTLEPLNQFYKAEQYHQDYAQNNPNQPYVKYHALPLASKVGQFFPELEKKK